MSLFAHCVPRALAILLLVSAASTPAWTQEPSLPALAPITECAELAKADFSRLQDAPLHITSAAEVRDAQPAGYCRILGVVSPKVNFEVRLPLAGWTQRYLQTGCGGLCGNLNIRVNNADGCLPAQRGEFALASTDMGHRSGDGVWQENSQQRIDFAYRGVHVTAVAAKALIEKFYGHKPRYSYFAGCSDGGREALMEAQRYPEDFDGITAGAPAMNFITQNTFYHAWNSRVNTSAGGAAILTADKLPALHAAAVAACDEIDGLKDGLINDPRACKFDPADTQCKPGQDPATCLTAAQVDVARKLYQGAHDAAGRQLVISGPQPGSEVAWRGVFVPNTPGQSVMSTQISTEVIKYMAFARNPPPQFTLADFRFDQATFQAIAPMHAIYDSTNPDLSPFAKAGGKLILWHGWSDPHISPLNTIAYYKAMQGLMGEARVTRFASLYLFPGGYHCGGGDGPFSVDLLSPITAWVERGIAPGSLLASHTAGQGSTPAQRPAVDRRRPVFPYPQIARYKGSGSLDDAASFEASSPAKPLPEKFDWYGSAFFSAGYEQWCQPNGNELACQGARK
ncbi:MAG TPA: tannase/feruloyl esterase family alpha/beta hydrolase [Paludibaculum sp.]|jgi:feruloyl esterase